MGTAKFEKAYCLYCRKVLNYDELGKQAHEQCLKLIDSYDGTLATVTYESDLYWDSNDDGDFIDSPPDRTYPPFLEFDSILLNQTIVYEGVSSLKVEDVNDFDLLQTDITEGSPEEPYKQVEYIINPNFNKSKKKKKKPKENKPFWMIKQEKKMKKWNKPY